MYCLNTDLEVGDILLIKGPQKHSKLISLVTNGPFSHACLVVGRTQIIEAVTEGIQVTSVERFVLSDQKNILVLRPNYIDEKQQNEVVAKISKIFYDYQGRGYNLVDAGKSIFGLKHKVNEDDLFCSQLVAKMYEESGFKLIEKFDHNVTPNDFIKCDSLVDVTSKVVCKISDAVLNRAKKNGVVFAPIDIKGNSGTVSPQAKSLREFVVEAAELYKRYGLRKPNSTLDIIEILTDPENENVAAEVDSKLCKIYSSKNINELIDELRKRNIPQEPEFYRDEFIKYGRQFANEEFLFAIESLKDMKNKVEERAMLRDAFLEIYEKSNLGYANLLCRYYHIAVEAGLFAIEEMAKQVYAYRKLYNVSD